MRDVCISESCFINIEVPLYQKKNFNNKHFEVLKYRVNKAKNLQYFHDLISLLSLTIKTIVKTDISYIHAKKPYYN